MIPFFSEVLEVASVLSSFDDECSFEIELQAIKVEIVNSEIPKPKTLPVFHKKLLFHLYGYYIILHTGKKTLSLEKMNSFLRLIRSG